MFDDSIIVRSGQVWKMLILVSGSIVSAISLFCGLALLGERSTALSLFLVLLGIGIFTASAVFACVSIRCPYCGTRWVWLGVTQGDAADWISTLVARRTCRACGR